MTEIRDMSPAMRMAIENGPKQRGRERKYPWYEIELGKSFAVPDNSIKLTSLTTLAYRTGRRIGKVFKVLHHKELKLYEVGYIADVPVPIPVSEQVIEEQLTAKPALAIWEQLKKEKEDKE